MPVMDGIDAAVVINQWRKANVVSASTKIGLVTGDETIFVKEYDKKIFDFIIVKPINKRVLLGMLKECYLV